MSETLWLQTPTAILFLNQDGIGLIGKFANSRAGNCVDAFWQARNVFGRHSEEELEVFAAMKSQREWIKCAPAAKLNDVFIQRQ